MAKVAELSRAAAPCGEEAVRRALQPLVLIYGVGDAARSPAFWGPYLSALRDVPSQCLAAAVEAYTSAPDSAFFPKPGPLKALADRKAEAIRRAASRAYRAARTPPQRERREPTPEERAEVLRMAAEVSAALTKPPSARPQLPPIQAKVDETGVSAELRRIVAEQRGRS